MHVNLNVSLETKKVANIEVFKFLIVPTLFLSKYFQYIN